MHTTNKAKTTFSHNGDFSGDIRITDDKGNTCEVPFNDIAAIAADYIRDFKMAEIEALSDKDLLGL